MNLFELFKEGIASQTFRKSKKMQQILTEEEVVEDIKAFVGIPRSLPSRTKRWESNFGGDRLSYSLDEKHIQNAFNVTQFDIPENKIFNRNVIDRWKLVNALLVQNEIKGGSLGEYVNCEHSEALSTLVAFPLLEFIAQRWTNVWNEAGILTQDVPPEAGIISGNGEPKTLRSGRRISSFYEKMQVLRLQLHSEPKSFLDNFDKRLRSPEIAGTREAAPLFLRLSNRRNAWAHGQSFNDGEPYILSLLISFFYVVSSNYGSPESK